MGARLGARGIKLHSRADGGFALNDPILIRPIVEAAAQHDLVVLFHTGEMHFAMPGLLWDLALDYPSVRFICGHMGGWDGFAEALAMAKRVENVWLDTTLAWPPNLIQHAVAAIGPHRLLYGSDSPYVPALAESRRSAIGAASGRTRWRGSSAPTSRSCWRSSCRRRELRDPSSLALTAAAAASRSRARAHAAARDG
jgi:Amidohydrolase